MITTVENKQNWAGNWYLLYKDGDEFIAEVDFPNRTQPEYRVYQSRESGDYAVAGAFGEALHNAETICFAKRGITPIIYPRTIKTR